MASISSLIVILFFTAWLQVAVCDASDQQIVYIRNTCECWSNDLKCVCKIESDPTSVRPLMQRLVNRTAEYYWQEIEFQSMVYDRTTFILANTFADGPFPSGITFKGDFSIVNDSFNHLNMTLNRVELNFETFSGRKPKFSKQYWRYIFDHGEATLRSLRIIKYQIEDFIIPNYMGAALTQEVRPLTEFKVVGCEVKEVKERAFKNFTQLEVLDLSDNHLTTLPENVFSRNINLQKILLANNQISFLTKTIFDGLPNLLLINLRKNKLTAVPAIPRHTNRRFQPMVYLMADNSIHCRCSLIWVLHELTFHHNLEIEATCSDPTMVRGMPIIEGFTRMDKEACYRVINARKDDADSSSSAISGNEPLALADASSSPSSPSSGAASENGRLLSAPAASESSPASTSSSSSSAAAAVSAIPSAQASPAAATAADNSLLLSGKSEVGAVSSAIPSSAPVVVPAHQESAARALETLISAAVNAAAPQQAPSPPASLVQASAPVAAAAAAAQAEPLPVAPATQLISVPSQTNLAPPSSSMSAASEAVAPSSSSSASVVPAPGDSLVAHSMEAQSHPAPAAASAAAAAAIPKQQEPTTGDVMVAAAPAPASPSQSVAPSMTPVQH